MCYLFLSKKERKKKANIKVRTWLNFFYGSLNIYFTNSRSLIKLLFFTTAIYCFLLTSNFFFPHKWSMQFVIEEINYCPSWGEQLTHGTNKSMRKVAFRTILRLEFWINGATVTKTQNLVKYYYLNLDPPHVLWTVDEKWIHIWCSFASKSFLHIRWSYS